MQFKGSSFYSKDDCTLHYQLFNAAVWISVGLAVYFGVSYL